MPIILNYLEDLANMGYAEISSVPVQHGLYAAAFGLIAFLPDDMASQLGIMIGAAALINEIIAAFTTKWGFKQAGEMYQASD